MLLPKKKHKFVICNPELCIGCNACMKNCVKEAYKRGKLAVPRLEVIKFDEPKGVMPNQCRQCDDAPCAAVCPTATLRNLGEYVEVYERLCIGCGLCVSACPYGAIRLESLSPQSREKDTLEDVCDDGFMSMAVKCDICEGKEDGGSACVECCPKGALVLLDPISQKHTYGKKLKNADSMSQFISKILACDPPHIEIAPKEPKILPATESKEIIDSNTPSNTQPKASITPSEQSSEAKDV